MKYKYETYKRNETLPLNELPVSSNQHGSMSAFDWLIGSCDVMKKIIGAFHGYFHFTFTPKNEMI